MIKKILKWAIKAVLKKCGYQNIHWQDLENWLANLKIDVDKNQNEFIEPEEWADGIVDDLLPKFKKVKK